MNKKLILFGSILAVVILVLASFPSVVASRTLEEKIRSFPEIKEKQRDGIFPLPGIIIMTLILWLASISRNHFWLGFLVDPIVGILSWVFILGFYLGIFEDPASPTSVT